MIGNNSLHSNNAPIIPTAESLKITTIIGLPGFIGKTIQGLPFCRLGSYIIPLLVNNNPKNSFQHQIRKKHKLQPTE